MNCPPVALPQTGSDMSFRILVPLAGAGCRLHEERLGSWADFIFPLCYMSRPTDRTQQYHCCWAYSLFRRYISNYFVFLSYSLHLHGKRA